MRPFVAKTEHSITSIKLSCNFNSSVDISVIKELQGSTVVQSLSAGRIWVQIY